MPKKKAMERAKRDAKEGKSASTQAGEFVKEEMRRYKEGSGPAKSQGQAVAIGLSEARRSGVKLQPPSSDHASDETRRRAERDLQKGRHPSKK